jgi:hypothetical protein
MNSSLIEKKQLLESSEQLLVGDEQLLVGDEQLEGLIKLVIDILGLHALRDQVGDDGVDSAQNNLLFP